MLNFRFSGKMSRADYQQMYWRLESRKMLLYYLVIYVVIAAATLLWQRSLWNFVFFTVLFVGFAIFTLKWSMPKAIQRQYEQNPQLQERQTYDFYKGMSFAQPIRKVSYFADALFFSFGKRQMLMVKQDWLDNPEHWLAFCGFVKTELDPKTKQ